MKYEIIQQAQFTILQISDERFDARLATSFREVIEKEKSAFGSDILIDVSHVRFMDSSGLGAVMGAYKLLRDKNMYVIGAQKTVQDLFKLTKMDRLIKMYASVDEAITASA